MKILTSKQIRDWDAYTIRHEPVTSKGLMERAAEKCVEWIKKKSLPSDNFTIYCGKGNNGGDGLAIARLLFTSGYKVTIYILEFGKPGSADFQGNLKLIHDLSLQVHYIQPGLPLTKPSEDSIIIDALYGSGLNKPLEGLSAELVSFLNSRPNMKIAIDMPSGLFAESTSTHYTVFKANYTLSFQAYKPALLLAENFRFFGSVHILDISLHPDFPDGIINTDEVTDDRLIASIFKPREPFAHKGVYGHSLLITGSYGKMGAAVLATKACVHSGAGLTTSAVPNCGVMILQISVPEAMVVADANEIMVTQLPGDLEKFSVIGIGPGIGTEPETQDLLSSILYKSSKPLVVDADGLNCISIQPELIKKLPASSILTPHPKEFDRLFGQHSDEYARIEKARLKAKELNVVIVLKGHHTLVATPSGKIYFNITGNAGMAKGGSGDVLTGLVTSLLSQGYSSEQAAILSVYIHGLSGDFAAEDLGQEAMTPLDLIDYFSDAFIYINKIRQALNTR